MCSPGGLGPACTLRCKRPSRVEAGGQRKEKRVRARGQVRWKWDAVRPTSNSWRPTRAGREREIGKEKKEKGEKKKVKEAV